jgi:hypothetical protein
MRKREEWAMKVVGDRVQAASLKDFDTLQRTVAALSEKAVCPRGVFRFRTFEEANEWKITMLVKVASRR